MSIFEAYLEGWKRYAEFDGESSRTEYWTFTIVNVVLIYGAAFIIGILAAFMSPKMGEAVSNLMTMMMIVFSLALFIPSLAITIRRLHDTGRSGWWILLRLVPFGGIVVFVFLVSPSTYGGYGSGVSYGSGSSYNAGGVSSPSEYRDRV